MSGYLLDTNVVSELTKENANPAVIDDLNTQDDLRLSGLGSRNERAGGLA